MLITFIVRKKKYKWSIETKIITNEIIYELSYDTTYYKRCICNALLKNIRDKSSIETKIITSEIICNISYDTTLCINCLSNSHIEKEI